MNVSLHQTVNIKTLKLYRSHREREDRDGREKEWKKMSERVHNAQKRYLIRLRWKGAQNVTLLQSQAILGAS